MNAPMLWIVLPLAAAGVLFLLRRWQRLTALAGVAVALALALAARLPIGETITLGPLSFTLEAPLVVLGRRLVLLPGDRGLLAMSYLLTAFWLAGSGAAGAGAMFVPLALGVNVLLVAALAVEPFLYAALIIELAALLCVPLLSPPGQGVSRGVLRFLTFQTFGLPFILITGRLLEGVETAPTDAALAARAGALLGLGFVFLLGIFPFHTWIPMLSETVLPYRAAYVFSALPLMIGVLGLGFLDRFGWLRDETTLYTLLRVAGELMIITGGVWAAFQRHLGRMLGFAVMVEIGFSLLAVQPGAGLTHFFALLGPRVAALGTWALALSLLGRAAGGLRFREVQGLARRMPLAAAAAILANFSIAGLPLLAGFPARLALWEQISSTAPAALLWTFLGCAGLFIGAFRTIAVLVMGETEEPWSRSESRAGLFFLSVGVAALLLMGLLPHWFLPVAQSLGQAFTHLGP